MSTLYVIRDWTSAIDMRNDSHPSWRIKVNIYRNCETASIDGYSIEVYDKSKKDKCCCENGLIYKFDIDCILPEHYSFSTSEAVEFLNTIGFNCSFDDTVFKITDEVRSQLENLYNLGYKTITRVVRPWCKIFLSTEPEVDLAKKMVYTDNYEYVKSIFNSQVSPSILRYYDYLFLPPNVPTPIDQILKN